MLVLYGLPAAGKSTVARMLEQSGIARRVQRCATRAPRSDDDPSEIECRAQLTWTEHDVVLPGWGEEVYLIRRDRVDAIRATGVCPVVEVGECRAAQIVATAFSPALLILVERSNSDCECEAVLRERGMNEREVQARMDSRASDKDELESNRHLADVVVNNDGTIVDIWKHIEAIMKSIT